jgi:hypothetical protein
MRKTTIYLPDDLKRDLTRIAATTGQSEAQLIRTAVETLVRGSDRPRPKGGLFASGDPSLSDVVDEALAGFGAR